MCTKNKSMSWMKRAMFALVFSMIVSVSYAQKTISMGGTWNEGRKSSSIYTISAHYTNDLLLVQSSTLRSDIEVIVLLNGTSVYVETVPAEQTAEIEIPITEWEAGTYTLELRNQWGDYLYGDFSKSN